MKTTIFVDQNDVKTVKKYMDSAGRPPIVSTGPAPGAYLIRVEWENGINPDAITDNLSLKSLIELAPKIDEIKQMIEEKSQKSS